MVKKLLFVIPDDGAGGAQEAMVKLAKSANKKLGKDNIIFVCLTNENLRLKNKSEMRIISLKSKKAFLSIFKLRKIIKLEKPELIISSMANCNIITLISNLFLNAKVICREDNLIFERTVKQESKLLKYILIFLRIIIYPLAFRIVAVSEPIRKELNIINFYLRKKLIVIQNPCGNLEVKKFATKEKFFIKKKVIKFIAIGRLDYQKDFAFLINSLEICFKKNLLKKDDIVLDIYGNGLEYKKLNSLIRELGLDKCIKLRGYKSNISKVLDDWDGLIATPRWEGFGMNLVEAMFSNIPILITECPGGSKELVSKYSKGFIAKRNYYDFCNAIKDFYEYIISFKEVDQIRDINYLKSFDNNYVFSKYIDLIKNNKNH